MSIYSYQVFHEVVKQGSFVKAAEKLSLTPSAVSHTVKALENDFGFPLFKRSKAGASLTPEGSRILPYVKALLSDEEKILQEVSRINNHNVGTVRIGMFASVASNWFVKILRTFRTKYPEIDIIIYQGSYVEIDRWLEEKKVDLAFVSDLLAQSTDFIPLYTDPLICVTPSSYVPKNKFSVTADDLRDINVIINSECGDYDAREFLQKNNITPGTYYDIVEHQTLFAMVKEGMGVCIAPELVARFAPISIKKYPIVGNPSRIIGLVFSDSNLISPAAKLLKDEIVGFFKRM